MKVQAKYIDSGDCNSMVMAVKENFDSIWYENGEIKFRIPVIIDPALEGIRENVSHSQLTQQEQDTLLSQVYNTLDEIALTRFIRDIRKNA